MCVESPRVEREALILALDRLTAAIELLDQGEAPHTSPRTLTLLSISYATPLAMPCLNRAPLK